LIRAREGIDFPITERFARGLLKPMAKTTCTQSRWVRRKEARPQELLVSALALFVEQGYA
jgi:hypothetical protein